MARVARRVAGHLRTVAQLLADRTRPPQPPPAEPWSGELEEPPRGRIPVSGYWSRAGGERRCLVILVHGLGGAADSPYLCRAAAAAHLLGLDSLRLNLRGADPRAGDFYHAGLTAELHAAVADGAFAGYRRIGVLGYSMGGHVALRYAAEAADRRVEGVATVCAPLDLGAVSREFDRPSRALYRGYVLRHLRRTLAELEAAGARLPSSSEELRGARTFRRWDELTVAPRFGFADADDYYARASAAGALDRLRVPCLMVASEADPMIPPRVIEPLVPAHAVVGRLPDDLSRASRRAAGGDSPAALSLLWHPAAGHVAFPSGLELERRLLEWIDGRG